MQRFFNSAFGVNLGLALGRLIPLEGGYRLASFIAGILSKRTDSPMVKAIRANQFVARGGTSTPEELDQAVEEVFTHAGRCFVDLYHNLKNPEGLKRLVPLSPALENLITQSHDTGSPGAFIVAPHLSNFDLVMLTAGYRGLKVQILSYGNPNGGYKVQNDLRAQTGLNITPISPKAHRQAIQTMCHGGFVATGIDRPVQRKTHYINFFGQPSPLPTGHIRMALRAEVPIIVAAAEWQPDGLYHLHLSDPIELVRHPDTHQEIRINSEAVLQVLEGHIRRNPGQWLMYYPVWNAE